MEPWLLLAAEWWWVAPAGAGAGALGTAGLRRLPGARRRRVAVDAALLEARAAHQSVARAQADVTLARAELLRAKAEQEAGGGLAGGVTEARRRLQHAERAVKTAVAERRARQAAVQAARAAKPSIGAPREALPLAQLRAAHDALTARWIAYETDPGMAIEHPAMSDPARPPLQAFLRAQQRALELRPASTSVRMAAADFAVYRDAVRAATLAFEAAERQALAGGSARARAPEPADWGALAQSLLESAQTALERSVEAWQRGGREGRRPRR